ncbi:MAG TPA: pyruvate ferredoxin oxidoreductase [Thermodesulfobacteriota bacterium]|nr:pyruvate ferredoxin oxidoreductase [Thermodesulfobacteriota bacterium]
MRMFLTGNYAAAYGARLARPRVIAAYPITPQSPIYEKLSEWDGKGELGGRMMRVESEHSAMAACIAASLTGVRTFTATASQGLVLMHELLHFASGMRAPVVMVNVNRALGSPWSFWSEQTDSLSQRDTGWLQFYVADNQEALDTVIQAYKIAEAISLPAMVVLEAFYTSHFMEPVEVPDQNQVDTFLPPFEPPFKLDPNHPAGFCQTVTQNEYKKFRLTHQIAMENAVEVVESIDKEYEEQFGRGYGLFESYHLEDAETVLVTAGTIGSTAKVTIDALRGKGKKVGMLRMRLFRPFPKANLVEALGHARKIAVIDRNISLGQEGIFCEELKSALYSRLKETLVFGFVLGLGGTNVSPFHIEKVLSMTEKMEEAPLHPIVELEGENVFGL